MEYENMRMPELKSLTRDCGLINYSRMRKAELVALFNHLGWNYSPLCGASFFSCQVTSLLIERTYYVN